MMNKKAPPFKATDQNNHVITLKQFLGQKVILFFYPKDNTPTCTKQACNLKDNYQTLIDQGFVVIGVSNDNVQSHQKFAQKFQLPFHLLADEDKKIVTDYGVYGEKKMYGKSYMGIIRTTFLIDEKGVVIHIISKPNSSQHAEEILAFYQSIHR